MSSRVLKTGNNQITQSYESHCNKVAAGIGWAKGVDIVKERNSLDYIVAHSSGTVVKTVDYLDGTNGQLDKENMGYGNYVIIKHNNTYYTLYAHCEKVCVKVGQKVSKGQTLAFMGNTGNSFGAHLHFEIRKYNQPYTYIHDTTKFDWIDPTPYLNADLPSSVPAATVEGFLDIVTFDNGKITASGWAHKDNTPETVVIKIFQGKTLKKTCSTTANLSRPDVQDAKKYDTDKVGFKAVIDVSSLPSATYTVKAYVGNKQLTNNKSVIVKNFKIVAGDQYKLNNTPVYSSEYGATTGKRSGIYYIWSEEVVNNRVRMTNTKNRVGQAGQVSFFVSVDDLKKLI